MKILLLGKTGQVGGALTPLLRQLAGSNADEAVVTLGRADVDLSDAAALAQAVQRVQPSLIVNAAAHTAVDRAETEPDIAFAINAVAPGVLAEQAAKLNALLVHYSTDYVFDGSQRTPYRESDPTHPLGVYGESKLAGEQAVQDSGCRHLLLRTSWVYDSTGRNFLTTMLRLAKQHGKLRVVGDQHGSPTSAAMIAEASLQLIRSMLNQPAMQGGLYHLTAQGHTTWHGFAQAIMHKAGLDIPIEAITTADYPTPAKRPAYSVLDSSKLQREFNCRLPDWQQALDALPALSSQQAA
jgi:dTDP-4-dehydrorhamnose reductase